MKLVCVCGGGGKKEIQVKNEKDQQDLRRFC